MLGFNTSNKQDKYHIEVQNFLINLSLEFINVTPAQIDKVIENSLQAIAHFIEADRCYIYLFDDENKRLALSHSFNELNISDKIMTHEGIDQQDFTCLIQPLLLNQTVRIDSLKDLPAGANSIKTIMDVEKVKTTILCPFQSNGNVIGYIGLDRCQQAKKFASGTEYLLSVSGKIISGAINRRDAVRTGIRKEQKFRTMFSEIEDVIFISTPEGRLMEINPAGARLFGFDSVRDILNINVTDLYFDSADREKYLTTIKADGQVKEYELTLKHKDGKPIYVLETSMALRDNQDVIIAYQGILRDVTDKRQLEQQLFQAKKMESIGLLAGGVAHDFNNILTTISGYAELMLMDLDKDNTLHHDVDNIIQGVKRAEDLIKQLLAFGRRQMIEPRIIDINKVISDLYAMLKRLISEDIEFDLNLKEQLSFIKADPVQIQQVLVNLVVNAGHAVKKQEDKAKGKKIIIHTDQIDIGGMDVTRYAGIQAGNYIQIAVEDTGIGMDEDTKQNIFEPFFSTKKEGEGTGLGLATVYGIVKQNHAFIYLESQPGEGAIFKILWPASAELARDETRIDTQIKHKTHSETILFVEDDKNVRELACKALSSFGYKVIIAENGRIALNKVEKEYLSKKIDLVISDIVMPEMGGEELAYSLRQLNPSIRILLCSGFTDSRVSMKMADNKNGFHFLPKPYSIKNLEQTIRQILSEQP